MWNCPISHESFPIYAEEIDAGLEVSPSLAMLADVARKKKVTIVGGSIPERSGGNLYNTCCVFDRNGDLKAKFRKVLDTHAYLTLCTQMSASHLYREIRTIILVFNELG